MTSFYSDIELKTLGLGGYGTNVLISRKASLYSPQNIYIGNNVRIDDFCILSGNINIGSYIHISAYVAIYGGYKVILEDCVGISPRATIYSLMDDFSGNYLVGPLYENSLTNVNGGEVRICKFAHICANSIVFPNCVINEGAVVGAMSMVRNSLSSWGIYAGVPAKFLKERSRNVLKLIYEQK